MWRQRRRPAGGRGVMAGLDETSAAIERFNDAFNRHDVEAVLRVSTPDLVFENTSGGRFVGQAAVRAVLTRAFALMATGWFETEDSVTVGDRCVVLWTYTFNRAQPARGQVRGVDVFRVRDGLVAEKYSYVKSEDFVRQLGLQLSQL
jgi:limonene-1,2-epoxide hydrolase